MDAVVSTDLNPVHTGLGSCFGACLLSLLAWLLHSWRVLTIATSAMVTLAACVVVPVLPESPRWLLNNGRKVTHSSPSVTGSLGLSDTQEAFNSCPFRLCLEPSCNLHQAVRPLHDSALASTGLSRGSHRQVGSLLWLARCRLR